MKKPFLEDHKADNGEHSHWNLIDSETGELLWTEDSEEEMAQNGRSVKRSHNSGYEARKCSPKLTCGQLLISANVVGNKFFKGDKK